MPPLSACLRCLRSTHIWVVLGVLAPLGMLAISSAMLLDMRREAYAKAEQHSQNLLQVIERDISRNIELFDLSLRAVVENLRKPELAEVSSDMRQLVLFTRAATARDMGVMLVLDERGEAILDEAAVPPRKGNYADREYFRVHKARADVGLYIGQPIISRLTGERMLPFSRRINKADGSFGGVAFSSLKLSFFSHLFEPVALGPLSAINLYLRDGTRIMRHPYLEADIGVSMAGKATFEAFVRTRTGSFIGHSMRDGIERFYAFTQIGDWPLVMNVALSTRDIEYEWRLKAIIIGSIVLTLCGVTVFLSVLSGRDLRRREALQSELARLSWTDALTGLPNRRRFEQGLQRAWQEARHLGQPLAMLVVDADHFKRINDTHGHPVGDAVLKELARCLSTSVHRPRDLVCRIGGEEFAVLLPDTDRDGALRVAAEIHRAVGTLAVTASGIKEGSVTVSIGAAAGLQATDTDPEALYRRADAAVYEAKAGGRNRTRCAPEVSAAPTALRLVGA